ncbi:MAG: hypothetical protein JO043_08225 [Candidatus Eremiobacteraeota bacterium]|nr:hypothetical protein [Candidatus Eremiobacteraeota bacterium]
MTVQLLIYSGRRDPHWNVHGAEAQRIKDVLEKTARGEATHRPSMGGLGYRGFLIDVDGKQYRVFRGQVTESPGARERYFVDTAGLESELLTAAARHGEAAEALRAFRVEDEK